MSRRRRGVEAEEEERVAVEDGLLAAVNEGGGVPRVVVESLPRPTMSSFDEVQRFTEELERYWLQGGRLPLLHLLSADAAADLELLLPDLPREQVLAWSAHDVKDDDGLRVQRVAVLRALRGLTGGKTAIELDDELARLHLSTPSGQVTVLNVARYVSLFSRVLRKQEGVLLPKEVVNRFLGGIHHRRFKRVMELAKRPDWTFQQCCAVAMEKARMYEEADALVRLPSGSGSGKKQGSGKHNREVGFTAGFGQSQRSSGERFVKGTTKAETHRGDRTRRNGKGLAKGNNQGRSDLERPQRSRKCYNCGEVGHIARYCPKGKVETEGRPVRSTNSFSAKGPPGQALVVEDTGTVIADDLDVGDVFHGNFGAVREELSAWGVSKVARKGSGSRSFGNRLVSDKKPGVLVPKQQPTVAAGVSGDNSESVSGIKSAPISSVRRFIKGKDPFATPDLPCVKLKYYPVEYRNGEWIQQEGEEPHSNKRETPYVSGNSLVDTGCTASLIDEGMESSLIRQGAVALSTRPRKIVMANGEEVVISKFYFVRVAADFQTRYSDAYGIVGVLANLGHDVILAGHIAQQLGLVSLNLEAGGSTDSKEESPAVNGDFQPVATTSGKVVAKVESSEKTVVDDSHPFLDFMFPEDKVEPSAVVSDVVGPGSKLYVEIDKVLKEFSEVFEDLHSEGADIPPYRIWLEDGAEVPSSPPRRMSQKLRSVAREEVRELLEKGYIRKSRSRFAAPIVIVRKKDGSFRLCIDYRLLNKVTKRLRYPLQNSKELLERLKGHLFFATLDLRSGFHQILMHADSVALTAFVTPDGLYEWLRMPFGLTNCPPYFQMMMMEVLAGLVDIICVVFIDDIIIWGDSEEEFLANLRAVLERLLSRRLRLKLSKCVFGARRVEYLGHIVDGVGVTLSEKRRSALRSLKPPKSKYQLRSFLGLVNYFRDFVRNFSAIAKPLTMLTGKNVEFVWAKDQSESFHKLKDAVVNAPLLHHIDYSCPIILRTDASGYGIGGMLVQIVGGKEVPVCYCSKTLTATQQNWSPIETEAYAIYYCMMHWRHFLLGHTFKVQTDHKNLRYLNSGISSKLIRWRMQMQEFDYEVEHIKGIDNVVADGLSRCCAVGSESESRIVKQVELSTKEKLKRFRCVHNAVIGHRRKERTCLLLRALKLEWPGVEADVAAFIEQCIECQKLETGGQYVEERLRTTVSYEPFEVLAVDLVGPFPEDAFGMKYVCTCVCCFTRSVELIPLSNKSAKEVCRALLEVTSRYGAPKYLRSDNGSEFDNQLIRMLCEALRTEQTFTIPYKPASNGLVERVNKEVMRALRGLMLEGSKLFGSNWSLTLPFVRRIIMSTVNRTTGFSPAQLLYGGAVSLDRHLLFEANSVNLVKELQESELSEQLSAASYDQYMKVLLRTQEVFVELAQEKQKEVVTKRLEKTPVGEDVRTTLERGSFVWLEYPGRPPSKYNSHWRGPLEVVEDKDSVVELLDVVSGKTLTVAKSRLRKVVGEMTRERAKELAARDTDEYFVERIIGHSGDPRRKSTLKFVVQWRGYEPEEATEEPYKNERELEALDVYLREHPELRL